MVAYQLFALLHPPFMVLKSLIPMYGPSIVRVLSISCLTEFSVLHHCVAQIDDICKTPEKWCQSHVKLLQEQWTTSQFDLGRVALFGEQPDLHMRIEAFFSGIKSLLDLMVQLLASEKIVATAIDGFHRDKSVYGGRVLKVLQNNVPSAQKELAGKIETLLVQHKDQWIDEAISARDLLIHPNKGVSQLMFRFECEEKLGKLAFKQISPPTIGSTAINEYAKRTMEKTRIFARAFISLVQEASVFDKRL